MASRCRKFQPNVFNKLKCQNCFGQKDHHSAEALENFKEVRKVSKAGYLFVAPDLDFNNPVDRTKRWQRRFFVLYDDGELVYLVDENPDTVPQERINMNKCRDVLEVEQETSHQFSISVVTPDKRHYMKGTSNDEIQRWFDVLVMYPRAQKIKHKRPPTMPVKTSPQQYGSSSAGRDDKKSAEKSSSSNSTDAANGKATARGGGRASKYRSDPGFSEVQKSRSLHDVPGYEELQRAERLADARRTQQQRAQASEDSPGVLKSRSGILVGAQPIESDDEGSSTESSDVEDVEAEEASTGDVLSILRHGTTGKPDFWKPSAVASSSLADRRKEERQTGRASLSPFTRSALALLSESFPSWDDEPAISTAQTADSSSPGSTNMTDEKKIANNVSTTSPAKNESSITENFRTPPEQMSPRLPKQSDAVCKPSSPPRQSPPPLSSQRSSDSSDAFYTPAPNESIENPFLPISKMETIINKEQSKADDSVSQDTDDMVKEVLQAQVNSLKEQLSAAQEHVTELKEAQLSLNDSSSPTSSDVDSLNEAKTLISTLKKELRDLRSLNQQRNTELKETEAKHKVVAKHLRDTETRLTTSQTQLQQERLKTGRWTDDWKKQVSELERRLEESKSNVRQKDKQLQQRRDELTKIRTELESSRRAHRQLQLTADKSAELMAQVTSLREELRDTRQTAAEARSQAQEDGEARQARHEREKARLTDRISELEKSNVELKQRMTETEKRLISQGEANLSEDVVDILSRKDVMIAQLEEKLHETEEELNTEIEERQKESEGLKRQLSDVQNKRGAIIEDLATQDKLTELEAAVQERDLALSRLRAIVTELERRVEDVRPAELLNDQYDDALTEVASLKSKCLMMEQQLQHGGDMPVPKVVANLASRVEKIKKPLSRLLDGLGSLSQQPELSADLKHDLSATGIAARHHLDKAMRSARRLRRDVKEVAGNCSELQTGLSDLKHNWLNGRAQQRSQLNTLSKQLAEASPGTSSDLLHDLASGLSSLEKSLVDASAADDESATASVDGSVSSSASSHDRVASLPAADVCRMLVDSMGWLRTGSREHVTPRSPDVHVTQLQAGLGVCRDTLQKALSRLEGCPAEVRRLVSESLQVCRACLQQHGASETQQQSLGDHLSLVAAYVQSQLALYARLCCRQLTEQASEQPEAWSATQRASRVRLRDLRSSLQHIEDQLQRPSQAGSPVLAALLNSYAENTVSKINALCHVARTDASERTESISPSPPHPLEHSGDGEMSEDSVTTRSSSQDGLEARAEPTSRKLRRLRKETEKLGKQLELAQAALENANVYHDMEMERMDAEHEQDLDDLCEKHDSEVEILRQALREAKRRLGPESDDIMDIATLKHELEKSKSQLLDYIKEEQADEDSIAYYKLKLEEQAEEIKSLKMAHRRELEQVQQDIGNVMKLVREVDEIEDESATVARLKRELEQEQEKTAELSRALRQRRPSTELSNVAGSDVPAQITGSDDAEVAELGKKLTLMQENYETELNKLKETNEKEMCRSRDDQITVLQAAEVNRVAIDENAIRSKYAHEIQQLKMQCEQGLAVLEQSHRRALKEMRRAQKHELHVLMTERHKLSKDSAVDTQKERNKDAPISELKKAHDSELQAERAKLQQNIASMYTESEVKHIQKQHESQLTEVQAQLESRGTQLAALQQLVSQQQDALSASRTDLQKALQEHESHLSGLRREVEQLRQLGVAVSTDQPAGSTDSHTSEDSLPELKLRLKAREIELDQSQHQIDSLAKQLKVVEQSAETDKDVLRAELRTLRQLSSPTSPLSPLTSPTSNLTSSSVTSSTLASRRAKTASSAPVVGRAGLSSPSARSEPDTSSERRGGRRSITERQATPAGTPKTTDAGGRQRSPSPKRTCTSTTPAIKGESRGRSKLAPTAHMAAKKEKRQRDFRRSKSSPGLSLGEWSRLSSGGPRLRTGSLVDDTDQVGALQRPFLCGVSVAERMRKFEQA